MSFATQNLHYCNTIIPPLVKFALLCVTWYSARYSKNLKEEGNTQQDSIGQRFNISLFAVTQNSSESSSRTSHYRPLHHVRACDAAGGDDRVCNTSGHNCIDDEAHHTSSSFPLALHWHFPRPIADPV